MCGRLNIIRDPLCHCVREQFGITFHTETNEDLKPMQNVATVVYQQGEIKQCNLLWGVHPSWANHLIINAKAETVAVKSTFIEGFEHGRVIVPCSGWYEWYEDQGSKRKYAFRLSDKNVLYMAGIALESKTKLVTLTTESNQQCAEYHERMPLFIDSDCVMTWLAGRTEQVFPFLINAFAQPLEIHSC